jgi:hypothetical protein
MYLILPNFFYVWQKMKMPLHFISCAFFCGEGPRSRSYGRTAALRLIVQPCDEDYSFLVFPCNGAPVE